MPLDAPSAPVTEIVKDATDATETSTPRRAPLVIAPSLPAPASVSVSDTVSEATDDPADAGDIPGPEVNLRAVVDADRAEQAAAYNRLKNSLAPLLRRDAIASRSRAIANARVDAHKAFFLVVVPANPDSEVGAERIDHIAIRMSGPRAGSDEQIVEHCYRIGNSWYAHLPRLDGKGKETDRIVETLVGRRQDF